MPLLSRRTKGAAGGDCQNNLCAASVGASSGPSRAPLAEGWNKKNDTDDPPNPVVRPQTGAGFIQDSRPSTSSAFKGVTPKKSVLTSRRNVVLNTTEEHTVGNDVGAIAMEKDDKISTRNSKESEDKDSSDDDKYNYSPFRRRPPGPNGTPPQTFAQICKEKGVPLTQIRKRCRQYVREGLNCVWWDTFVPPPQFKDEEFKELSQTPPKDPTIHTSPAYYLSKIKPKLRTVDSAEMMEKEEKAAEKLFKMFEENKKRRIQTYKELGLPHPYLSPRGRDGITAPTPNKTHEFPDDSLNDSLLLEYTNAVEEEYNTSCQNRSVIAISSSNRENESECSASEVKVKVSEKNGALQEISSPVARGIAYRRQANTSHSTTAAPDRVTKSRQRNWFKSTSSRSPVKSVLMDRRMCIKSTSPERVLPQPRQLNFENGGCASTSINDIHEEYMLLNKIALSDETVNSGSGEKLTGGEGFEDSDSDDDLFSQIDY